MSKLEQLKDRARSLEARDPKRAVDIWIEALKAQESDAEANPDLSIYNRVGDLLIKLKEPGQAADYYDRAVDKYAELGFHNNAIAMCNKVLRNAPARQTTYLKLAKLYAAKGFTAEAKQNFVEYAERMQRAGKVDHAFAALKEVTDLSPDSEGLRAMLAEHLKMYGEPTKRPSVAHAPPPPSDEDLSKSGKRKTSSLVFLDLDEPSPRARGGAGGAGGGVKTPPPPPPPPSPAKAPPPAAPEVGESIDIEATSLADEDPDERRAGPLEGLETTHVDFGAVAGSAAPTESLREDLDPRELDLEPMGGLEPTVVESDSLDDADLVLEGNLEPPKVKPVVPKRPAKPAVEVPPLELEPDFDTTVAARGHEVDDRPLAMDEGSAQRSGVIDLGFSTMEQAPEAASLDALEARVAHSPDDPDAHQALGEALIEAGARDRGIEELDIATAGFENAGQLSHARDLVDEILRLDPNSVRHRQKAVEFSFKASDKAKLVDAYLELADTLLRTDLPDKARAVYERVAEHDSTNERAKAALAMLAPLGAPAKPEGKVKAKDARMKVRHEAAEGADFVDLGAMILEAEGEAKDTRMTVEDEEPTGDEETDFREMLARFKQGIDENIDEADFQSHYDLGVAFREMGLLDEAISEFQKALRAPEGKLRTSEALGMCFFDKGAHGVAESILRRGLELAASGDQERLGILYWLGRALEEQGKKVEARDLYGRAFAVDIRFMDVEKRVKALAKAK